MKNFMVAILAMALAGCKSEPLRVIDFKVRPIKVGGDVTLSTSYKGKPVFVYIWATWCGPCKEFAPVLNKLADEYQKKGIAFLAVAQDDFDKVQASEKKEPHRMDVYTDDYTSLSNYIEVGGLPTLIVLNSKHELVWKAQGISQETETALRAQLDPLVQ